MAIAWEQANLESWVPVKTPTRAIQPERVVESRCLDDRMSAYLS